MRACRRRVVYVGVVVDPHLRRADLRVGRGLQASALPGCETPGLRRAPSGDVALWLLGLDAMRPAADDDPYDSLQRFWGWRRVLAPIEDEPETRTRLLKDAWRPQRFTTP
jgi:hypothetical protein